MSTNELIKPKKADEAAPDVVEKTVKKKGDIVERKEVRIFTEDGKEILS